MEHPQVYNRQAWRELPRNYCAVALLFGDVAGPCRGLIHHHHVDPDNPSSRTVQVCAAHHPKVHAALRSLTPARRRCSHHHRYDWARRECERRLNS
jgi:hypothetical protein